MGQDQPFIYDPPTRNSATYPYSDFNPRAATQAHYAAFAERAERNKLKSQQQGPLINFNAHPDSYMIVPSPTIDHKPLPASTKKNIIWTRWVLLTLRMVQEVGALGILVCVICLKMKNDAPGYMIRVAPAFDSLVTMYAIYHLFRAAKGRTPGSSASYHFFALFTDTALVPFYVLICLYANQNWDLPEDDEYRWTSFFNTEFATMTIIHVTFYAGIAVGALHLISVGFDLYLIHIFRKIAHLPPDMNPLEENLTGSTRRSRLSMKHKHKNSEITISSLASEDSIEKKPGYLSGSTLSGEDRSYPSAAKGPEASAVPFSHSRKDLNNSYSPQSPSSPWKSQQQYEQVNFYQGPRSARSSRQDVGPGHRSRAGTLVDDEVSSIPAFSNRPDVRQNTHDTTRGSPDRHAIAPSRAAIKSQQKHGLLNDNWYVLDEEPSDLGTPRGDTLPRYQPEPTLPNVDLEPERYTSSQPPPLRPLKMNPPTPPPHDDYPDPDEQHPEQFNGKQHGHYEPIETGVARTMTVASHMTAASSVYSESAPSLHASGRPNNGAPKGRHYGDLASATRGVRGAVRLGAAGPALNRPLPGMNVYGVPTPASSRTPSPQKNGGRVISRSGADIADANLYSHDKGYGMSRREVSGKIAEEGRSQW